MGNIKIFLENLEIAWIIVGQIKLINCSTTCQVVKYNKQSGRLFYGK